VKSEISGSKDIVRVMTSIYVFCWLLLYEQPTRNQAFHVLLNLLGNRYPKVRKLTADELYIRVMTDEQLVPPNSLDEILNILSTTNWNDTLTSQMKEQRDNLYSLLNLVKPVLVKSVASPAKSQKPEDDNYKDLVKETGY